MGYSVPRDFSWIEGYKLELGKFGKIEQGQKVLISTFASFLTAIAKISPHRFEIFSKIHKILSPKSRGNFVYQVCYSRYHVSFYLWRIGPVLKHCKVPKYQDHDYKCITKSGLTNQCSENVKKFKKNITGVSRVKSLWSSILDV